jgi:hypothetical protein
VFLTGEAAGKRDFGNTFVAFAQEPFGAVNPHLYQVLMGSLSNRGAEPSREMARADTCGFCDRRQVKRAFEVRIHEVDCLADLATPLLLRHYCWARHQGGRGVPSDEASNDGSRKIVDVDGGGGIIIMEHVTHSKHQPLDQRIAVPEPRENFDMLWIPGYQVAGDLFENRPPQIEVETLQSPVNSDAEIHATWHHEHAAGRDYAAALPLLNPAVDCDRAVKMEDDQLIVDRIEALLERNF